MQPQHIWPYLQQNFIHHTHFPHPAFLTQTNGNSCQPQATSSSSPGSTISDSDNHSTGTITSSNNNTNNNNNNDCRPHEGVLHNDNNTIEDNNNRRLVQSQQDKQLLNPHPAHTAHQVIAKPMPSRPTPFLPHSLNHPHLHSLLAHCRNPYMSVGAQVFPLPPGQGFPWAHSTRGKPRRGMMRRAVFSDSQRKGLEKRFQQQKYISKPDRKKLAERLGLKDSQNFIHHTHFPHPAFLTQTNGNSCQPQATSSSSPGSTISDSDNHSTGTITSSNNNTNNNNNNDCRPHEGVLHNDNNTIEDNNNRRLVQSQQDKQLLTPHPAHTAHQVIAKPMPSRPTPFLPHSLNHPHLHSLLAHCRNPYMSGKYIST
ncbi:homeobox protein 4 [Teleopsis dalmanni]|uniref:homeobox protein 4 n=1 Tax=Teleopsis dalmanni TaxID=139649 RepID=UPI0018CEF0FA|nr:homeobox protein 4 [Teleopsis dalmanni]